MNEFNDNDPEIVEIPLWSIDGMKNELEAQQIAQEFWAMIERSSRT